VGGSAFRCARRAVLRTVWGEIGATGEPPAVVVTGPDAHGQAAVIGAATGASAGAAAAPRPDAQPIDVCDGQQAQRGREGEPSTTETGDHPGAEQLAARVRALEGLLTQMQNERKRPRSALPQGLRDGMGSPFRPQQLEMEEAERAPEGDERGVRRRRRVAEDEAVPADTTASEATETGGVGVLAFRPRGVTMSKAETLETLASGMAGGAGQFVSAVAKASGNSDGVNLFAPTDGGALSILDEDIEDLREAARDPKGVRPFEWTEPPVSWEEARSFAIRLLRANTLTATPTGGRSVSRGGGGDGDDTSRRVHTAEPPIHEGRVKVDVVKSGASTTERNRAASADIVAPLCAESTVARERATTPLSDPLQEARRLVTTYGSAWAMIFSSGKVDGALPADGKMAASFTLARQTLERYARQWIGEVVGRSRKDEVAGKIEDLVGAVVTLDLTFEPVVYLLGGVPPPAPGAKRTRAVRAEQGAGRSAWGKTTGPTAVSDVPNAMKHLGELLGLIHGVAGGGTMHADNEGFGLHGFASRASRELSEAGMSDLFSVLFGELRSIGVDRRRGASSGPLDIGAEVTAAEVHDVPYISNHARVVEVARETAAAAAARGRSSKPPGSGGMGGGMGGGAPPPPPDGGPEAEKARKAAAKAAEEARKAAAAKAKTGDRAGAIEEALRNVPLSSVGKIVGVGSMANIFDDVQLAVGTPHDKLACPFATMVPPCTKKGSGSCTRCASEGGGQASPDIIAAVTKRLSKKLVEVTTTKRTAAEAAATATPTAG
jgi:hypothetical protein